MDIMNSEMVVFSGRSNWPMAQKICCHLGISLGNAMVKDFSDGENWIALDENVRLRDIFLIQSTCQPDKNIIELLLMIDAAKRASAARITAVVPYFGYARQDRKNDSRMPIAAKLMADLIEKAGADRVITMDLHAGQIQGFFTIPVDNLYAKPVLVDYIKEKFAGRLSELALAAPDVGGVQRTRSYAKKINNAPLLIIDKRRDGPNQVEIMNIVGTAADKIVIVIDDIIDTAKTFVEGAETLISKGGAREVHGFCVHPVLSGEAIRRLSDSRISSLTVTDTIPLSKAAEDCLKINVVSVAGLIAEAMRRSRTGDSVGSLFI